MITMDKGCPYDEPWIGRCGKDIKEGTSPHRCGKHDGYDCWCGKPGVRGCSVAVSFVCGRPLCEDHKCNRKGRGMTGDMWHSKEGRDQYKRWKE